MDQNKAIRLAAVVLAVTACTSQQSAERAAIETAKNAVRQALKDGQSAQFENVVFVPGSGGQAALVCGWVNGKNSFGAYAGAESFLVADGRLVSLGDGLNEARAGDFGRCAGSDPEATNRVVADYGSAVSKPN